MINITNPFHRLLLKIGLYAGVFLFTLLFFIYLFFPYNRWKGDLEDMLSQRMGKNFKIEEVEGWRLVGVKLNGVTITPENKSDEEGKSSAYTSTMVKSAVLTNGKGKSEISIDGGRKKDSKSKKNKGEKTAKEAPKGITIDSIAVRPAILSFIFGSKAVIFSVDIFDGDIDGKVKFGKKTVIDIDIDDIDVREITFLENMIGLPFIGEVDGTIDLEYSAKRMSEMSGDVKLTVKDLHIGDKDSKLDLSKAGGGIIKGAIKFEPVEVGDLVLKLSGEDGKLKIVKMEASSKHIQLHGAGELKINQPISLSILNLYIKFKFLDAYVESSSMTKSVFSTLDRLTKFRQAKRTDGFWGFAIRGTLSGGIKPIPAKIGPGGI